VISRIDELCGGIRIEVPLKANEEEVTERRKIVGDCSSCPKGYAGGEGLSYVAVRRGYLGKAD
jgi:hypothetical protein